MHTRCLFGCIIAVTLATAPLARAMPGNGAQTEPFKYSYDVVSINHSFDNGFLSLNASVSDNATGYVGYYRQSCDPVTGCSYVGVTCSGPSFAQALSINPGNGNLTLNAVIDPASPECSSWGAPFEPMVLDITGRFDGVYHNSQHGTGTSISNDPYSGTRERSSYSSQSDMFSEAISGTVGGEALSSSVSDSDNAYCERRTGLDQRK
jgi:hypothetical protein